MGIPIRVLLIEDSVDDAVLVLHELMRGGYTPVMERVETEQAMRDMLSGCIWDIIIADYTLPQFNALAALHIFQKSNLDIPFIILSGNIGEELAVAAMKAGAHDCIMKDSIKRLVPAVERELRESSNRRERLQAENALKESEARNRALVETAANAGVGIAVVQDSKQGSIIVYVNNRLPEMLGLREKDLIGARLLDIVAPDHRSLCLRYYEEKLADDGKKGNIEIDIICNNGDLLSVEVAIGITMYESKPATVAYILDITERKYAEKRARELEALKEIDSLRGELVANVSHELRTPLTAIKGFVSTLLRTDVQWSDEEKEDFLKTIAEETNRLASLIDDTLDISRIETGTLRLKRGYYTAADVFQSIHTNLASLTSCHLLEISLADGLPVLYIDKARIGQVLINLVENAAKYSPERSIIKVEAISARWQVIISVIDKGTGIPQEMQNKIFDRFFQTESIVSGKKKGTGLGLSICKGIVEAHGGSIWVESKHGEGSIFKFSLPVLSEEEEHG